jgi:hypothetical protein
MLSKASRTVVSLGRYWKSKAVSALEPTKMVLFFWRAARNAGSELLLRPSRSRTRAPWKVCQCQYQCQPANAELV